MFVNDTNRTGLCKNTDKCFGYHIKTDCALVNLIANNLKNRFKGFHVTFGLHF